MPEVQNGMFANPILSNIVLGIPADEPGIVDQLLPIVSSPTESFDILKVGDETNMFEEDDRRAKGGESNEINYGSSKTKGYVVERSLSKKLDSEEIEQARRVGNYFRVGGVAAPLTNPEVMAQVFVRNRILKGREVRGARVIQDPANYAAGHVINAYNAMTGDLELAFDSMRAVIKGNIVGIPRVGWMSFDVFQAAKKSPTLRSRIFGTAGAGLMTKEAMMGLLGLDELLIGSSTYATKVGEGDTAVITNHDLWTGTMGLMYRPSMAAEAVPAFGYTFTCPFDAIPGNTLAALGGSTGLTPGFGGSPGQAQLGMAFQEPLTELRMAYYYKERYRHQVLDPRAGVLWTNVITHL